MSGHIISRIALAIVASLAGAGAALAQDAAARAAVVFGLGAGRSRRGRAPQAGIRSGPPAIRHTSRGSRAAPRRARGEAKGRCRRAARPAGPAVAHGGCRSAKPRRCRPLPHFPARRQNRHAARTRNARSARAAVANRGCGAGPSRTCAPGAPEAPRPASHLRQHQRRVEGVQPRHGGDRQLPRRRGQEPRRALARAAAERGGEPRSRPSSIRTRAATSSSPFGPDGAGSRRASSRSPSLPGGLLVKVGKMRSEFGKVNPMHTHVLPWTDRPLVTRNLVGGDEGISDGGISVSKLIPNPLLFLEATGEVFGGDSNVFSAPSARRPHLRRPAARLPRPHRGHQPRPRHVVRVRATTTPRPTTTTRLIGVDATFRYRPLRRAIYQRFLARTELVWSRQDRRVGDVTAKSFGIYASGEYQFARRWFGGVRYDYSERALDSRAAWTTGALRPDVLAERVQPGARPVPAHELRRGRRRPTSSCSSSCSRSAPTGRTCSRCWQDCVGPTQGWQD